MSDSLKDVLSRAAEDVGRTDPDLPSIERRGRRRRAGRRAVTGAIGVVVALAIALPLYGLSGVGGSKPAVGGANSIIRFDVDGVPQPIAAGDGAAWVDVTSVSPRGTGPSTIWRIDEATGQTQPLPATTGAVWVAVGEGAAWATCFVESCGGPAVLQLDQATGDVMNTVPITGRPQGITTGLGAVWVTTDAGVVKIDAKSATVADTFGAARGALVATTNSSVWVAGNSSVIGLDPDTGAIVARVPFKDPCTLTSSAEAVYVASCQGAGRTHDELVGIDAKDGSILFATPRDGWGPMDVMGNAVIVAQHDPPPNGPTISLISFDAQTGQQLGEPFDVPAGQPKPSLMLPSSVTPMMMSADQGFVWVTDFPAGQVIRVDMSAPPPSPAPSSSPDVGPNGTYVNPMGIPITVDYPKDWFAQSVSQSADPGNPNGPPQIGMVLSNSSEAMPSPSAAAPSPGPLPDNPQLPEDYVMVTILTTDTATDHGLTDTPLPLSMDNAKPFPGPANIRGLGANVAGRHLDITVYAGPRASDADIAAAASIVASIRPTEASASPIAQSSSPSGQLTTESMMLSKTPGVRCTATLPTVVDPGEQIPLKEEIQNVSTGDVDVSLWEANFSVKAGDGSAWDTTQLTEGRPGGPFIPPKTLRPGQVASVVVPALAVQFPGPLTITPTCLGETMPPISGDVSTPDPTPTPDEALAKAVTASSGLFGPCAPTVSGSATGTIAAPTEATMTMTVRCSAQVTTESGFSVVTLEMSTPSDRPSPKIADGIVMPPDLATDNGAAETLVWRFVVTGSDAFPVGSATQYRSKAADAMDTQFDISPNGWRSGGASHCGGDGIVAGGDGRTVTIVFYNACG